MMATSERSASAEPAFSVHLPLRLDAATRVSSRDDDIRSEKLKAKLRVLNLVGREEFDIQRCVLLRTLERLTELELELAMLKRRLQGGAG